MISLYSSPKLVSSWIELRLGDNEPVQVAGLPILGGRVQSVNTVIAVFLEVTRRPDESTVTVALQHSMLLIRETQSCKRFDYFNFFDLENGQFPR